MTSELPIGRVSFNFVGSLSPTGEQVCHARMVLAGIHVASVSGVVPWIPAKGMRK